MTEIILAVFLALDLALVAAGRLVYAIKLVALQGVVMGLIPFGLWHYQQELPHVELLVIGLINIGLKGVVLPRLLLRSMRRTSIKRELEPMVGYTLSLIIFMLAVGASFWFAGKLDLARYSMSPLASPVAFSTMFAGLFLIMARRKAIMQALGFLVFENGITLFGIGMMLEFGMLVELGILLDVLVLVFVMGIALFHISREFDHIDSDRLNQLSEPELSREERQGEGAGL